MSQITVLTHRGLEPSAPSFFSESSFQAFSDQAERGFGLEFDPSPLADGNMVITHDATLKRITGGKDAREVVNLTAEDIEQVSLERGRLSLWPEFMPLIRSSSAPIHALHCKGLYQRQPHIDTLLRHLEQDSDVLSKLLLFDVRPDTAEYMKSKLPQLLLAPSVAHPYDIARFNHEGVMFGTLMSIQQAIELRSLYSYVWLDEWDRNGPDGSQKIFYCEETFRALRAVDFQISLVTPELHGTSPGLLGSEAHQDAANKGVLFSRLRDIVALGPDAICTDYPEEVRQMCV